MLKINKTQAMYWKHFINKYKVDLGKGSYDFKQKKAEKKNHPFPTKA